mmetsp:Transcript_7696/g.19972  ORF Transcript_7696/g.19972 Transcript_7696/m.19972 type:complete len:112 (-) Transcript_7696:45-380(-)
MAEEKAKMEEAIPEDDTGYKVAEKVDLKTLTEKDKDDESLQKYKAQLLGAAASGQATFGSAEQSYTLLSTTMAEEKAKMEEAIPEDDTGYKVAEKVCSVQQSLGSSDKVAR